MKLVTTEARVREATGTDPASAVVDTATLDRDTLRALFNRLVLESAGELVGHLNDEHPNLFDDDAGADATAVHDVPAQHSNSFQPPITHDTGHEAEEKAEHWFHTTEVDEHFGVHRGGLVTVKEIIEDERPYQEQDTADSWLQSIAQDLVDRGINPNGDVESVLLWYPRHPHTHYEVGALIEGGYAKFDLTAGGYRLIYNADNPADGDRFERSHRFVLSGATARTVYKTFLEVAHSNGPYADGTNDCHRFAVDLCGQLSGQWLEESAADRSDHSHHSDSSTSSGSDVPAARPAPDSSHTDVYVLPAGGTDHANPLARGDKLEFADGYYVYIEGGPGLGGLQDGASRYDIYLTDGTLAVRGAWLRQRTREDFCKFAFAGDGYQL
jgi:hypothetical protein